MYDIITFGSATRDIVLRVKDFKVMKGRSFTTGEGFCFNLGSKVDVQDVIFLSGGGGTNTAATFISQGFRVAYCGTIGKDHSGNEIVDELQRLNIDTRFIQRSPARPTNHSIILCPERIDRTVLVYRGASELLERDQVPWNELEARWLYLAPLSGKLADLFGYIVEFAREKKMKIAVNPGNSQITLPKKTLAKIVGKVDILILNQEEAALMTKIPYKREKEIFKKIDEWCPGVALMTQGPRGAVASDGKYLYYVKAPKIKVVDRTGAGDSFAAGFLSGYIQAGGDIVFALQLAIANSSACLGRWGAKNGLLKKGDEFAKVPVNRQLIV